MSRSYVIAAGHAGVGTLVAHAAALGGEVVALVVGPRGVAERVAAAGVTRVVWFDEAGGHAAEAFAPAVAALVGGAPGHVFAARRPADRVLLGAAAAALAAPVVADATAVADEGGRTVVTRAVYGGIATRTVAFDGPVAFCLDGGAAGEGDPAPVERADASPAGIVVTDLAPAPAGADLTRATSIVAVGGGLRAREDLALVEQLAAALGAEVGCTRPIAEGLGWLPRDRYIGVSGLHVAPELYVAVGISGQLQHMAGCRDAKTVVAVNTDAKAPIMSQADYVLPADLYELVPALTRALG